MTECVCPNCTARFTVRWNRKLMQKPNLSILGPIGTIRQDIRDFDRVVCPKCNHEFAVPAIRMFGLFPRHLFWLPLIVVLAVAFIAWAYVSRR